MHYGSLETSERIRRTLYVLKAYDRIGATTADVHAFTGSMAPATDISALRHNGYRIRCEHDRTKRDGTKVFRYYYEGKGK